MAVVNAAFRARTVKRQSRVMVDAKGRVTRKAGWGAANRIRHPDTMPQTRSGKNHCDVSVNFALKLPTVAVIFTTPGAPGSV